jgi:hypothetical protein
MFFLSSAFTFSDDKPIFRIIFYHFYYFKFSSYVECPLNLIATSISFRIVALYPTKAISLEGLPGGLACQLLRDASTMPQPDLLHVIEAEDPVGILGHGFRVPVQCGGVQVDGGASLEACFIAWATRPTISLALS